MIYVASGNDKTCSDLITFYQVLTYRGKTVILRDKRPIH